MDNKKTKTRQPPEKQSLLNRLSRIEGQVKGLRSMVEEDRYCDDILTQVAAAESSIRSFGLVLLENHLRTCVKDRIQNGNEEVLDELMITIGRFSR
ncbi:MAG TPA: hypothetical protein DD727_05720 [Clostridiales bacterium]|nr:hypothetical protein [Clostridiales bacterium]